MGQDKEMNKKLDQILAGQKDGNADIKLLISQNDLLIERLAALFTQGQELHEFPIPRLFIILPKENLKNCAGAPQKRFRLYFLCECGRHTMLPTDKADKDPPRIHIAKHEGYELRKPKEFLQKYGGYMLALLLVMKAGITVAGFAVPTLAACNAAGGVDVVKEAMEMRVDQSIKFLQELMDVPIGAPSLRRDLEADAVSMEGADLRRLEAFLANNDKSRTLGNLYRTVTIEGHVKWVCIDHYRSAYNEKAQKEFADIVRTNRGTYNAKSGKVILTLNSKAGSETFFRLLAKARKIYDLDLTFDWECDKTDLKAFERAVFYASVTTLRLDLRRFRSGSTFRTSPYEILFRIINVTGIDRTAHIVLDPKETVKLLDFSPRTPTHAQNLSVEISAKSVKGRGMDNIAEALKKNATVGKLHLGCNTIDDIGAQALAKALVPNSTLISLNMEGCPIKPEGTKALFAALKFNSTLLTLDMSNIGIENIGARTLLKDLNVNAGLKSLIVDSSPNKTPINILTLMGTIKSKLGSSTMDLRNVLVGSNGAHVLAEALKTNRTVTQLLLGGSSIGYMGAHAVAQVFRDSQTLTTVNLENNSIGDRGAKEVAAALTTSSSVIALNLGSNSIGDLGAQALANALMYNSTLTSLNIEGNSITRAITKRLSERLRSNANPTNSVRTWIQLRMKWSS